MVVKKFFSLQNVKKKLFETHYSLKKIIYIYIWIYLGSLGQLSKISHTVRH